MKLAAPLILALSLVPATSAFANDTSAVLTTGGLEFVTNENVEMVSEDLFISRDEIRVKYEFRNTSDVDQNVLVAFPMPDITPNWWSPVAFPEGPASNPFEFKTTFNGKPVKTELHEYAIAAGVDRSDYLRDLGIPLMSFGQAAADATDALDEATIAEMLHLGMAIPDEFDQGEGWETHHWPMWTWRATYTWDATFPAGETVTVEHSYKPSVGGTVAVSFLGEAYEDYDPAADYAEKYCTDESFLNAVRKTIPAGENEYAAPFTEQWISYILTTGGNWSGNYIAKFRLVVDKGDADNLISFCGDDVKKIGPTTFEMVKTEFSPEKEIDILILNRNDPQ